MPKKVEENLELNQQRYLFLLKKPSLETREKAKEELKKIGVRISALLGDVALIGHGSSARIAEAGKSELFYGVFSKEIKDIVVERFSKEQKHVIDQWNFSFTPQYARVRNDKTHVGKKWNSSGMQAPSPTSSIDPQYFKQELLKFLKMSEVEFVAKYKPKAKDLPRLEGKEFVKFERKLAEKYGETEAYHLARMAVELSPEFIYAIREAKLIVDWLKHFLEHIRELVFAELADWKLENEISVGVVFVESEIAGGPTFTATERQTIEQEIMDGLTWLTNYETKANITWVYDWQYTTINVANGSGSPQEDYWRNPAMQEVSYNSKTYTGDLAGLEKYRSDMRVTNRSAHAVVIFVTPYANWAFAYASPAIHRITLAKRNNWGNWGIATINALAAHEMCHLFGATDEYTGSGTPCSSCGGQFGVYKIPNGNCASCSHPHQVCLMDQNTLSLCGYSQGHIGWADLFVELTTADVASAGTNDDVWLEVAGQQFLLDTPNHSDRQQGNIEGYALNYTGIVKAQVSTVGIRKAADGAGGNWKLEKVRLWCNGELLCDSVVNKWLDNTGLYWQM
jgi:hypothetical protein